MNNNYYVVITHILFCASYNITGSSLTPMINLLIKTGTACWKPRINEFLHVPQNDNLETETDQKANHKT